MTARRPVVAGNWKMHLDHVEAVHVLQELALRLRTVDHAALEVCVLPPFTDLRSASSVIEAERLDLVLGAQHASEHDPGPYTGEVGVGMLARLGVDVVLVGHSERRRLYAMDDATVARTAAAVLAAGLRPMVCVGELADERAEGATEAVLARQLDAAMAQVGAADPARLLIAYEPVWAIGTDTAATPEDAQAACAFLRARAAMTMGEGAMDLRILYGGSATEDNAASLVQGDDVDGLLVGGASLAAASFTAIVGAVADCYGRAGRSTRR